MTQPVQLATTVTGLSVIPQMNGVSMSFGTTTAVRAQLQVGTVSGTYGTKYSIESVPRTTHQHSGAGLLPNTVYHYILQFMDQFGNALDATADATFTTLAAPAGGSGAGAIIGPLFFGTGVPAASLGIDGGYYFRSDGATGAFIYHRAAGAWTAVI
jgi:hypothetical protein